MTSDKKKQKLSGFLGYFIPIILSAFFLYIAFYDVDITEVFLLISNSSLLWVSAYLISLIISHYLRAVRWKIIMHSIKQDVPVNDLFASLMVGYGVNAVVPRLGEISRAVVLGNWEGVSRTSVLGTIVVERVIDIIFFGLAVVISALVYDGNLYENFQWLETTLFVGSIIIFVIIIFLILLIQLRERFYNHIIKLVEKISPKIALRLSYIFKMLTNGFSSLKGVKNYSLTLFFSLLIMLIYGLNSYIGLLALDMQKIAPVDFGTAWIIMSIGAIGIMIPTPGGIGSYHTIVAAVLVTLFGFEKQISTAYATLTHAISYFTSIFLAIFLFFFISRKKNKLIDFSFFSRSTENSSGESKNE